MKKVFILTVVMLFVASATFAANYGKSVMPYWWMSGGAFTAAPVVFCAHSPYASDGTADVTLTWYTGSGSVAQTDNKYFNGAGHQRFDKNANGVGFATVEWSSFDGGQVGCTGVEWFGAGGSLYHVPFVD